eukprot:4329995-Pyramimonas_sp.AAC.1
MTCTNLPPCHLPCGACRATSPEAKIPEDDPRTVKEGPEIRPQSAPGVPKMAPRRPKRPKKGPRE